MHKKIHLLLFIFLIAAALQPAAAQQDSATRNRNWREDIAYFRERFPAMDKTLTPFMFLNPDDRQLYWYSQKNSLDAFLAGTDDLYRSVDTLSDEAIMTGLAKLVALSPNAHTRLYLFRVRTVMNNLPIGLQWFGSELRIVSALKTERDLLGARILAINGRPIDSVKRIVDTLFAGGPSWKSYMSLYTLRSPQALKGLGITTDADHLTLTLQLLTGITTVRTLEGRRSPQTGTLEAWKNFSPLTINSDSLAHLLAGVKLPPSLRFTDRNYAWTYSAGDKLVYLSFTRCENDPGVSFKDFTGKLIDSLAHLSYTRFVLDLRFNTGGDNGVAAESLKTLGAYLKGKKVYVITGPSTFSAGVVCAAIFKRYANARIFGEEAGDGLVFLSEGGNVILPHSKLAAHYANGFHNWLFEPNFSITPDAIVPLRFDDYRKGRDAVLDKILKD